MNIPCTKEINSTNVRCEDKKHTHCNKLGLQ